MNYHIMIDHWFINGFINIAEQVSPGNNTYIVGSNGPGSHVDSTLAKFISLQDPEWENILARIEPIDRIFIHWFHEPILEILYRIDSRVRVYLLFWGGDLISQTKEFDRFNFDRKTKSRIAMLQGGSFKFSFKNPFGFFKVVRVSFALRSKRRREFETQASARKDLMCRVDYFCHWNRLDMEIVRNAYGGNPEFVDFFYEGGLEKVPEPPKRLEGHGKTLTVWLGNSDTATNNHFDAIDAMKRFRTKDMEIICPLSYGWVEYGDMVTEYGTELFGKKWRSLRDFIPLEQYLELQRDVDVVVMYHNRSQAGFNVFGFIKMGKKVFLKEQSSMFEFLRDNGILVFKSNEIERLTFEEFSRPLSDEQVSQNNCLIKELFSTSRKVQSYQNLLC